jgi:hypothetical protein
MNMTITDRIRSASVNPLTPVVKFIPMEGTREYETLEIKPPV